MQVSMSTVTKRIFFGSLMAIALVGGVLGEGYLASQMTNPRYRGLVFAMIVGVTGCCGLVEFARLCRSKQCSPPLFMMIAALFLVVLVPFWGYQRDGAICVAGVFSGLMMVSGLYQGFKYGTKGTILNLSVALFGVIYLGLGCYFLVQIRLIGRPEEHLWGQIAPVIMFLACVKSADIGAYFTGRSLGRHKWVPSISPAKTWEGLAGGVILAVMVALFFALFSDIISSGMAILFGLTMAITGQLGDLLESMLKRDAGIKDSASLIPEFGGFLDLIDSPVVAAPFAYGLLTVSGSLG